MRRACKGSSKNGFRLDLCQKETGFSTNQRNEKRGEKRSSPNRSRKRETESKQRGKKNKIFDRQGGWPARADLEERRGGKESPKQGRQIQKRGEREGGKSGAQRARETRRLFTDLNEQREREREQKKNTPCSSSIVDATLFQESHPQPPSGRSRDGFKNSAQRRPARPQQAKICAPLFSPRNTRPDFPWDSFSDMLTSPSGCLGARVGIDYSARSVSMYERERALVSLFGAFSESKKQPSFHLLSSSESSC